MNYEHLVASSRRGGEGRGREGGEDHKEAAPPAALRGSCRRQCSETSVHGAEGWTVSVRGAEQLGAAGLSVKLLSVIQSAVSVLQEDLRQKQTVNRVRNVCLQAGDGAEGEGRPVAEGKALFLPDKDGASSAYLSVFVEASAAGVTVVLHRAGRT